MAEEQSTDDIVNAALDEHINKTSSDTGSTNVPQSQSGSDTATNNGSAKENASPQADISRSKAGTSGNTNDTTPAKSNQNGKDQAEATRPGRVKDDGRGNLVDEQGRLVASSGSERRWYNEAQALSKAARQTQQELEGLRAKVDPYEKAFSSFANLQMPPQDIALGAQLFKSFQTHPKETIEYLLTEARKNGVQVEGMGQGVDIAAIKSTVQDMIKPLLADREAVAADRAANETADREIAAFYQENEFGKLHENEIAQIVRNNPTFSLTEAYLRLENAAMKAGLDFTQPLQPQWEAKRNGGVASTVAAPVSHTGNSRAAIPSVPLPGARPAGNAAQMSTTQSNSVNQSNADIVREVLREFQIH